MGGLKSNSQLDLIEKYIEESNSLTGKEFIAPIVDIVKIRYNGLIYTFHSHQQNDVWGVIQPINHNNYRFIREAEFFEVAKYLENLPKFKFILIKEMKKKSWIAMPYNLSDVNQRIKHSSNTFIIHLVNDASTFDNAIAAFDGVNFWFESLDNSISYEHVDRMRKILLDNAVERKGLTKEQKIAVDFYLKLDKDFEKNMLESKIVKSLNVAKAKLKAYVPQDENIKISWESEGHEYSSLLRKKDFTVVSSGICLSNKDSDFDLTSIVNVLKHKHDRDRDDEYDDDY